MSIKEELQQIVVDAKARLNEAENNLFAFDGLAENNIFASLDEAEGKLTDVLSEMAFQDCEGAHNCGSESYSREFIVGGVKYLATMKFEYNRHDKMYYYIEESEYSYKPA